ncbi:hypothetical protein NC651_004875 [Populus alba x Populus x berolinensis]|nr:hypothetical protein NC651_004875 [Populus alba x Populus x berolinensis]
MPEAYEKRYCVSSHGWLVMVQETPAIFLLNPLTKARIDLPSLSTFPAEVVFKNSRYLHPSSIRSSKQRPRDRFIRKVRVSADPSLVSNFMVVAIYGWLRKYHVPVYGYETFSFVAYKLQREESKWSEVESLGDKMLFLGWNCSHSVSALDFNKCKGDCIYFTDDNLMACADFIWEGHDFGVFDFHGGNV